MNKVALGVVISLLAGFAVGAWFGGEQPAADQPVASRAGALPDEASAEDRLLRLEQIIAEERDARFALEDTLALLFEEIERLDGSGGRAALEQQTRAELEAEAERQREARRNERRSSRGTVEWMRNYQERRVGRMVEGGFAEDEARRILQLESEAAYKALEASWDAQRQGEALDPFAAAGDPQSILRSQIGDDAYTRYLEAQGQPTAVSITQVLDGSPGGSAGLLPGDEIVNYNGERVFSVSDLRNLTMQGNRGEDVVIEINRDGTRMQLTVPRGPVGITGTGAPVRGARWWGG
ncbi:MAG: PDZ domain-containing protein [Chromatiales bacterium]|nr:MAG: PDZ domain-containing protein [Chromatiales bacterium]